MANITINKNGPYHIKGPLTMKDHEGNDIECEQEVWLCRCGHSRQKPFCDGTHKKIGFSDDS